MTNPTHNRSFWRRFLQLTQPNQPPKH